MGFKTLPIFTLATYRMGSNFSIRVTPNINLITVGLKITNIIFTDNFVYSVLKLLYIPWSRYNSKVSDLLSYKPYFVDFANHSFIDSRLDTDVLDFQC